MKKSGKIGEGAYGSVYSATNDQQQQVAFKRNITDENVDFIGAIRELSMLTFLKGHPNIVEVTHVSFGNPFSETPLSPIQQRKCKDDELHFIFEKASCTLLSLIESRTAPFSTDQIRSILYQILTGVAYMHEYGIAHLDLKPVNILIFGRMNETAKLCDMGLAYPVSKQDRPTTQVTTCWYRAPEIILGRNDYTVAADMWSVGCILYEMMTKQPLLHPIQDNNKLLIERLLCIMPNLTRQDVKSLSGETFPHEAVNAPICTSPYVLRLKGYPPELSSLLVRMLTFSPEKRMTAAEALKHPFFSPMGPVFQPVSRGWNTSVKVYPGIERKWAIATAHQIYNSRQQLTGWYRHRSLFQAIDLFDRYLDWAVSNALMEPAETESRGRICSYYGTNLRFVTCLYVCIKFFSLTETSVPYSAIAHEQYKTKEAVEFAREFEKFMVEKVCQFCTYRPTMLEMADRHKKKLTEEQVRDLFIFVGSAEYRDGTMEENFTRFMAR